MGRSSFGAPPLIHAHAIAFMGWVVIYLTQNVLVASGNVALHRRLGWLAAGWVVLMLVLGCAVTAFDIRVGRVPFFFRPVQFLVFDPLTLFAFAGLTYAAIALRRRTDWHRRLHFSGMAMMIGFFFVAIALLYRFGPSRPPPPRPRIKPGAALATVLWLIASELLSLYVSQLGTFGATYGSLGAAVGIMLWFYVSAYAVLLGAELNARLEEVEEA